MTARATNFTLSQLKPAKIKFAQEKSATYIAKLISSRGSAVLYIVTFFFFFTGSDIFNLCSSSLSVSLWNDADRKGLRGGLGNLARRTGRDPVIAVMRVSD